MTILDAPQSPINESTVPMQPVIIKWGLISAAVSIIFQLLLNLVGLKSLPMMFLIIIIWLIVGIYILVLAVRADRDDQLMGYASFKRVFMLTLAITLFSTLIFQVFSYVYMNYLNPSAANAVLEDTRAMMERMNVPENQIDEALDKAAKDIEASKSPFAMIKSLGLSVIFGAIISAIYGAVMKKERPMFN